MTDNTISTYIIWNVCRTVSLFIWSAYGHSYDIILINYQPLGGRITRDVHDRRPEEILQCHEENGRQKTLEGHSSATGTVWGPPALAQTHYLQSQHHTCGSDTGIWQLRLTSFNKLSLSLNLTWSPDSEVVLLNYAVILIATSR